jgi:hypothetical protein
MFQKIRRQKIWKINKLVSVNAFEFFVLMHIAESICESISEKLVLPRCPNEDCKLFVPDFDACSALMCGEHGVAGLVVQGCGTRFCGWCFTICPDENKTHDHVRACAFNPNK